MKLTIKKLIPELLSDYLYFFDHIIFSENPDWSKCYCYSYHFTGKADDWTREKNRAAVIRLIKAKKMKGYLAFDDKTPVGWCNTNDRLNYQSLVKFNEIDIDPIEKICSVVCFVIHPDYRQMGIATQLLLKATEDYSGKNFDFMEAYPGTGDLSCEKHYKGPLSMYEMAGFKIHKKYDHLFVVRKNLRQISVSSSENLPQ